VNGGDIELRVEAYQHSTQQFIITLQKNIDRMMNDSQIESMKDRGIAVDKIQ
jgi:hypothetical protein